MAIEPVDTLVGLQIRLLENPVDRAAGHPLAEHLLGHLLVMLLPENLKRQAVQSPGRVRLLVFFGLAAGQSNYLETFGGGKRSGGDRIWERLVVQKCLA